MPNYRKGLWVSALVLTLGAASPLDSAFAAGGGGGTSSGSSGSSSGGSSSGGGSPSIATEYRKAYAKVEDENYRSAIPILEKIVAKAPRHADALNLLGYSHRKLGNTNKALKYYLTALSADPKHRGANEYLGELYLEMGDLEKAEERLAVLSEVCDGCEEQEDLAEAIAKYKAGQS
jgi:tetratricopeptide (TPR) repeat protein